ncbi:tryptophan 2:3-dioxygenase-like protein [Dinothrombium tinctorium]|uniref:Tryptophan 2,3-dioxygenase n=1 Tax=Dinothrombium tinctorium TaxID=1965070 RepID=A0A3S3RUB9_9ACAR|nr:tryptophan 2:3-dioxygenase-like protein [Dinothrombium tinctorium]RWS04738.1 tryptophan 2:3-dioxygenase-like protein [Dinothrombium tinctorium]RWS04859.1 tryptophan 2:3-dioxygenase-like protein [Dinothrombium tinctorium]
MNANDEKREIPKDGLLYGDYLMVDRLLSCQQPITRSFGKEVHDEHLFIVTHQAYELWFKQIIFELDYVRHFLSEKEVKEKNMLFIVSCLSRIMLIWKLLVDQVEVLESMTPLDFMEFRSYLSPASGFQSVQFRLIENKLGVRNDLRTNFAKNHYLNVFENSQVIERIKKAENEPSLRELIEKWLERTPGLEADNFNFWERYKEAVNAYLEDLRIQSENQTNQTLKEELISEYNRKKEQFDSVFDETKHKKLIERGIRRFSHKALQGALMISLYRDEPRFNQPFHMLTLLMDIDALITKWRYNHVQMVLRMIGSQQMGTGGSPGYEYLRSTLSDKYKVFVDLFNLSTFLIPRSCFPPLTSDMRKRLAVPPFENGDERAEGKNLSA